MGKLEIIEEKRQILWKVDAGEAQRHLLEWRMLEHNQIDGFLPFDYYYIDNEIQFRYDYSSYQRVGDYFNGKNGSFEIISFLCGEVLKVLVRGEEYLLDLSACLLLPECIFWNRKERQLKICFLPGKKGDARKEYTTFVEYLMQYADHGDEKLVSLVYGFYDRLTTDLFSPEQLLQYLYRFSEQGTEALEKIDKTFFKNPAVIHSVMRKDEKKVSRDILDSECDLKRGFFLEYIPGIAGGSLWGDVLCQPGDRICMEEIGEFVVGRDEQSDICLPFQEVSRRQAILYQEEDGFFVMDAASKNGTYLNDNKISAYVKMPCKENDILTFADISYKIRSFLYNLNTRKFKKEG